MAAPDDVEASTNAMRDDRTDLRQRVDHGFTEMHGKLDATAAGQQDHE